MKKNSQNRGFIQAVILVIIVLIIMRYNGVTISGVWEWLKDLFYSVW